MKERILIENAGFTVRVSNALLMVSIGKYGENELVFLDDLEQLTSLQLRSFRGISVNTLREIRKVMAFHGLKLKDDYLASSEEEKKLIQEMPNMIMEMSNQLREITRQIDWIRDKMEMLHANMKPL